MKRDTMHSAKTNAQIRTIEEDLATVAGGAEEKGHWIGVADRHGVREEWVPYSPPDPNWKPSSSGPLLPSTDGQSGLAAK